MMPPQAQIARNGVVDQGWISPTADVARSGQLGELLALERIGTRQRFARDESIYAEGDAAQHCYKVISGTVRTSKLLGDGRRHIAEFLFAGDFFGFEANSGEWSMSAEAVEDVVLMCYPRAGIERLAEQHPAIARRLRELAFENLAEAHGRMLLLGRMTASERVAAFLIEVADRTDCDTQIELSMARGDIADYLGLTTETVSRVISALKRCGAIAVPTAQRIDLLDREALEAVDCAA